MTEKNELSDLFDEFLKSSDEEEREVVANSNKPSGLDLSWLDDDGEEEFLPAPIKDTPSALPPMGTPLATPQVRQNKITPAQDEDEVFSTVDDVFESEPTFEDIEEKPKSVEMKVQPQKRSLSERTPTQMRKQKKKKKKKSKKEQSTFIDEENNKLLPFGATRKEKVGEFDPRSNDKRRSKIVQFTAISLLVAILGAGLYNAVVPVKVPTRDEIAQTALEVTGDLGFPREKGEAFAHSYLKAFLTNSEGLMADNDQAIVNSMSSVEGARIVDKKFVQNIVFGPELSEAKVFGEDSAQFIYSVGVTDINVEEKASAEEAKQQYIPKIKWASYAINVFYDKEKDGFSIVPGSPIVLPEIKKIDKIPRGRNLAPDGEASPDKELGQKVSNTVEQFFMEYVSASPEKNERLLQYIIPDPPAKLLNGLDGAFKIDPAQPVNVEAWKRGKEIKAIATVGLQTNSNGGTMSFSSKYAVTLVESKGTYLVSDVKAMGYAPRAEK